MHEQVSSLKISRNSFISHIFKNIESRCYSPILSCISLPFLSIQYYRLIFQFISKSIKIFLVDFYQNIHLLVYRECFSWGLLFSMYFLYKKYLKAIICKFILIFQHLFFCWLIMPFLFLTKLEVIFEMIHQSEIRIL
jgi:hypothetical protein